METLVRVTDLSRRFGSHLALSGVNLCLERGEVLGLLGPNGAGKTTCLRLLGGMLAPDGGRIEIQGIDLARRPLEAKRHLGYLPERPPLYPELRVDEYLTFCARLHRLPRRRIGEAIEEAKHRCGLEDAGRRLIAKLSKGFRQRLGIAQAILHKPALLILDEPTEGLDPFQMRELRGLIRELAHDCGIILSSHLLPEVQAVCDRVAILYQGQIRFDDYLPAEQPVYGWRIRLGPPSSVAQVADLPGVAGALALGDDRYRVMLADDATSADLARVILLAGLELRELIPDRSDLERVFFDLIGVEEAA
ncbi:ABC transporter ATP-binding protein [Thiobaca trueperi]|uniref:ABC-2 type transport system ATP-binding protein n=1 Tax=Thiobaca trueperi TaxID=127458 RepID=A0A4R3N142_9GAMM|nr:ABC transporter ATP-binding protein [Thiobaca trueperi]TCT22748.1 ABC-2 type transport system ATP-binding protein [Thiobaca trueperi]